jgi:LEA14-like dessication related protein
LKKNLLPSLFLIAAIVFFACEKPHAFEYRDVKNLSLQGLGFDKSELSMELVYYNPNSFGVDLRRVDCDVYIDSSYLGKYHLDTLMHINRKSEFSLPSRMEVDMKGLFKNAVNVLFRQEVMVTVKGTTRVGKAGVFVTVPFSYSGKHQLGLF